MRRWALGLAVGLPLLALCPAGAQQAPAPAEPAGPPHEWAFGIWTGGLFPAGNPEPAVCYANATVIVLRDVVLRASALEVTYQQRVIATVARAADGRMLEFRFVPAAAIATPFGARLPAEAGFGCEGGPNVLRAERRGADEMVFPDCRAFLSPLKRCGSLNR